MQYVNQTPSFGALRTNRSSRFHSHEPLPKTVLSNIVYSKYEDDDESYPINTALFKKKFQHIVSDYDSAGGSVRSAKISTQMAVIDHCLKIVSDSFPEAGVEFPIRILDFTSAYMERAVAAKILERLMTEKHGSKISIVYHGIDPDSNITAISKEIASEIDVSFSDIPLEQFVASKPYHIILMSTPPYDLEVYGGDCGVSQTYKSFNGWKSSFWKEVLYRAKSSLAHGGVFSFTCLDRPARPDRAYTAYACSRAMKMFEYNSTFVVGKGTPWWTFVNHDTIPMPVLAVTHETNHVQTLLASALLSAKLIDQDQFRHEVFRSGSVLGGNVQIVDKDVTCVAITCMFGENSTWRCNSLPECLIGDLRRLVIFLKETDNTISPTFSLRVLRNANLEIYGPQAGTRIYSLLGGDVHHSSRCIDRDVVISRIFNNKKITHVFSSPMLQDAMAGDAKLHGLELIHHSPISAGEGYLGPYKGTRDNSVLLMNPPREVLLSCFANIYAWSVMADSTAVGATVYVNEGIFAHCDDGVVRLVGLKPNPKYPDSFDFASKISQLILSTGGNAIVLDQERFYQIDSNGNKFVNEKRDKETVSVVFLRGIKDHTVLSELSTKRSL